ncbi:MAG: tetratricopeptide repeat protein [Pyrinomonadaceae bacterium]|nr:tetratricopeptide repeat protein [Pyrinomonadaceae bacterium]
MRYIECPNFKIRLGQLSLLFFAGLFMFGCGQSSEKFISKGEEYLKKRKFYDAMMQFRSAAEYDRDSAKAHWGLARSYENLGRFNDTLDELRKTVELDPKHLDAKARLGNYFLLIDPPMIDESEKVQQEIISIDPKFIEGHVLKASILAAQNRPETEVVAKMREAIAIDSKRTETYLSLSRYYVSRDMAREAEDTIKQGIDASPGSAVGLVEYGRFLTYAARNPEAEVQFRNAIAAEPTNIEANEAIADFYVATRQYEKAEAAYQELVRVQDNSAESRLDLAEFYVITDRPDVAEATLLEIIRETPDYTRARYRLGQIYLDAKDSAKVNEQVDALLKINNNDVEALMLRARVRMLDNRPNDAITDLEDILKKRPSERDALFYISQAKITIGQLDQARAFIADLEKFHPSFLRVGLLKIQAAMAGGDTAGALKQASDLYLRASSATPNAELTVGRLQELQMRALSARGLAYLEMGRLAEARSDLEEILRKSPKSVSGMLNLAKVDIAERKPADALALYEKALGVDARNFDALSGLVSVSIAMGQTKQAHMKLDAVMAANVGNNGLLAALHYLRSGVYTAEKDRSAAETELRTAIELDNGYLPAYSAYAALLVARNETASAIEQYRAIVAKNPTAPVFTLIGILEDSRSNQTEAEICYRRALELSPDSTIAANNLAWLIAENQGNLDEALQLASASVNRNPDVAGFYDTLGYVYLKKGLYLPAVEQLRKAVLMDEKAGNKAASGYRVRLAMALASAGDKSGARREAEASLRDQTALSQSEANDAKRVLESL